MKRTLQQKEFEAGLGPLMPICSPSVTRDMLFVIMEQCKYAEKEHRFVQDVTCAPEPMAVLCTDQQLLDINRFCCDPFRFCIFGVDPTLLHPQSTDTSFWKTPKRHSHHCFWGLCLFTTISIFEVITTSFQRLNPKVSAIQDTHYAP